MLEPDEKELVKQTDPPSSQRIQVPILDSTEPESINLTSKDIEELLA